MGRINDIQLRRSHDAMARFLLKMLKFSDEKWHSKRSPPVEKHYREALKLVRQAGLKYNPSRTGK